LTFFRHGILSWRAPNARMRRPASRLDRAHRGRSREPNIGWRATEVCVSRLPSGSGRCGGSRGRSAGGGGRFGRRWHLRGLSSVYPDPRVVLLAGLIHDVMPRAPLPVALLACRHRFVERDICSHFLLHMSWRSRRCVFKRVWLRSHQGIHASSALLLRYVPGRSPPRPPIGTLVSVYAQLSPPPDFSFGIRLDLPLSDGQGNGHSPRVAPPSVRLAPCQCILSARHNPRGLASVALSVVPNPPSLNERLRSRMRRSAFLS
jgi:hypothetical protein